MEEDKKEIAYGKTFSENGVVENRNASLEKIINMPKKNKFGVNTIEELEDKLAAMNKESIQRFCISIGETPTGSRSFLKRKIVKSFKKFRTPAIAVFKKDKKNK